MKLNNQILRSRSVGPLNTVEYLDLSELGLGLLGRFTCCPKVASLILRGNKLQDASGLEACRQLWYLDLSNNQVWCVEGLSRFLCLGTLILSNNQLTWASLTHLRHLHINNLSLHGNPQLEKDPYYRIHVIDCLPNVWMLDGRIVTSFRTIHIHHITPAKQMLDQLHQVHMLAAERIQVRQFFHDSALTERPVRHKLRKESFVPSKLKRIEIDGIFGEKAVEMMTSFPKNEVLNVDTDWRRLQYLAQSLQQDISREWEYTARKPGGVDISQKSSFLTDLFDSRSTDRERCNMVLLMLVASLNFVLPTHLVRDTLDTGKLLTIGSVQMMDLFLLPRLLRCKVVSLLVSAVKVDREQTEDGGLYIRLYLCLYHMVSDLTKLSETTSTSPTKPPAKLASQLEDYKCLLATEVVQLMCIVPSFFEYLDKDIGVMNLVRIATADPDINEKLLQISKIKGEDDLLQNAVYKETADFLLMKVQEQLQNLTNKATVMSPCDRILSKSGALPMKGEHTPVHKAEYLVRGVNAPDDEPPVVNPRKMSAKTHTRFPYLGDQMLLGPQTIGKIISLPQPTMALVIIDAVPVASGAVEHKLKESDHHYTYVNMKQLQWDPAHTMWKPRGTVGDKYTLQAAEDFNREALTWGMADESFRPCTPEIGAAVDLEVIRASTPLIYTNTPRHHVCIPTDRGEVKVKTRRPQRPLSSVYKERLKLSLDLSRRAQSARSRQPFAVTYGSKTPTPKSSKGALLQLDLKAGPASDRGVTVEVSPSLDSHPPLLTSPDLSERNADTDLGNEESARVSQPAAQSTPKGRCGDEDGKENMFPPPSVIVSGPAESAETHLGSPADSAETHSGSPADSAETHSGSPADSAGTHSGSPADSAETHSGSPADSAETHSGSPADYAELHSGSPADSPELHSGSPADSAETHSGSDEQLELAAENQAAEEETSPDEQPLATDEEQKTGAPGEKPAPVLMTTRSDSALQWMKRSMDGAVRPGMEGWTDLADRPTRGVFITSVSESPRTFDKPYQPDLQLAGRSRPFSAVEVRRRGGPRAQDNVFHTQFQQQRMDAWKHITRPASSPRVTQPSTVPPPPQPPSSPVPCLSRPSSPSPPPDSLQESPAQPLIHTPSLDNISSVTSFTIPVPAPGQFHYDRIGVIQRGVIQRPVPRANLWLAGGRDLFREGVKQRPKSGHTPGWKEGLPDNMKTPLRPQSASARLHRHTKTPSAHPPSPSRERKFVHDFPAGSQHMPRSLSRRRYNAQRSLYDEDPLPGPMPEHTYSPIKVLSYQRPPGYTSTASCLPCLYEDYFQDLEFESQYTPACNSPTCDAC